MKNPWNLGGRLLPCVSAFWMLALTSQAGSSLAPNVNELFAPWDRKDSPGAAVIIIRDGAVVYQHGYGYANLEHHIPITPQTVFDVASVAKQFTGLSIAMLVQQGKLSVEDDVHKFLPATPDFGKPITIAHLLHHTSGLRDWPETLAFSAMDWSEPITMDIVLEMVRRQRELDFAPGEEHQYSNTGYNLLAATVARITGQPFRTWMDENLFRPLGMKRTSVCSDAKELIVNAAESYAPSGKGKFHRVMSQLAAEGSSSLFTTAEDMGKWLLNFENGRVGGDLALELMIKPGKLNNGNPVNYGFGLGMSDYHGAQLISHSGSWAGYRSVVMRVPGKRFALAILSNAANLDAPRLGRQILDLYLDDSPPVKSAPASAKSSSETKADPKMPDDLPGTYRLAPGWLLTITREGNRFYTQATNEDKARMTPMSGTKFFVDSYGAEIEFVQKKSGEVTHLLYRGMRAPRLDAQKITVDDLNAYAGDYWSEELRVVCRVELKEGKLGISQRSGTWIHLLPTGKDRFDTDAGRSVIQFTRNGAAEATELKISGGRVRNIRYQRITLPRPN